MQCIEGDKSLIERVGGVDAKLHVGEVLRVGYPSISWRARGSQRTLPVTTNQGFGASCPVLAALRSIPVLYLALDPLALWFIYLALPGSVL